LTLASTRRVVTFDNAGVGGSTGTTSKSNRMAHDAIALLAAMKPVRQLVPAVNLVLVKSDRVLAGLETALDRPTDTGHPHQGGQPDRLR
jgi:pimeloyl-ACP methyl ester carboxylesterase